MGLIGISYTYVMNPPNMTYICLENLDICHINYQNSRGVFHIASVGAFAPAAKRALVVAELMLLVILSLQVVDKRLH